MFFRKNKHVHEYYNVGIFYKENLTRWKDRLDFVEIYRMSICSKCGDKKIEKQALAERNFMPECLNHENRREREKYTSYLSEKGIPSETEITIKSEKILREMKIMNFYDD